MIKIISHQEYKLSTSWSNILQHVIYQSLSFFAQPDLRLSELCRPIDSFINLNLGGSTTGLDTFTQFHIHNAAYKTTTYNVRLLKVFPLTRALHFGVRAFRNSSRSAAFDLRWQTTWRWTYAERLQHPEGEHTASGVASAWWWQEEEEEELHDTQED